MECINQVKKQPIPGQPAGRYRIVGMSGVRSVIIVTWWYADHLTDGS